MLNKYLWIAVLSGFFLATTADAQAPEVLNPPVKTTKSNKKKPKKPKTASGSQAKFMPGSQETNSQRVARLKRECKGGVDAGACAGYTK